MRESDDTEVTYFLIMGRETPFRSEEEAMQSYERRGDELRRQKNESEIDKAQPRREQRRERVVFKVKAY
jgi:hypothetical protein